LTIALSYLKGFFTYSLMALVNEMKAQFKICGVRFFGFATVGNKPQIISPRAATVVLE